MNLSTLCLGLLLDGPLTGYALSRMVEERLGHFQHASFGALYPALGKLEASGLVTADRRGANALSKRIYAITEEGRSRFNTELVQSSASETFRSEFLTAMHFADHLPLPEIERLVDQKLADAREQRRRLLALPISSMTEGQRFTVRYSLAKSAAVINFLQGEGRAMVTSIQRERL
jgi:PadR family transcriptional regulator AphA